jgi:hypothetical protein
MGSGIEPEEQFPCETPPGPNPEETAIYPSKPAKMSINCPKTSSSAYPRISESASLITHLIELFLFLFSNIKSPLSNRLAREEQRLAIENLQSKIFPPFVPPPAPHVSAGSFLRNELCSRQVMPL